MIYRLILAWILATSLVGVYGSTDSLPVDDPPPCWNPTPVSTLSFPSFLLPVVGSADDQCEHFYIASATGVDGASLALTKLNTSLGIVILDKNPIPSALQQEGYLYATDLEWDASILYVPVNKGLVSQGASATLGSVILTHSSDNMTYRGYISGNPLDSVLIEALLIDYGSRLLYAFPTQGLELLVYNLATNAFQQSLPLTLGSVSPTQVRGAILQQPNVAYLLSTNLPADSDRQEDSPAALSYTISMLDLLSGVVGTTLLNFTATMPSTSPAFRFDASGLANLWSADEAPNLGLLHVTDSENLYGFNLCQTQTMRNWMQQFKPTRNCPRKQRLVELQ